MQSIGLPLYLKIDGTSFAILVVIVFMQGVVFIPLMPLSFDYSCDILFPAGEAQITGTLMASGNLLGVLFVLLLIYRRSSANRG